MSQFREQGGFIPSKGENALMRHLCSYQIYSPYICGICQALKWIVLTENILLNKSHFL